MDREKHMAISLLAEESELIISQVSKAVNSMAPACYRF